MCQHVCFVLFLTSQRFLLFGHCAFNTDSRVCASLLSFLFSLPLSPPHPVLHVAAQGVKGQPGEKVSPHFALHLSAPVSSPWILGVLPEAPSQPRPSTQAPAL